MKLTFDEWKDWKEREKETADLLTACESVMREDGHYDQCPCPGNYSHDYMYRNPTVQICQRLQYVIAKAKATQNENAEFVALFVDLLDAGLPTRTEEIDAALRKLGYDPEELAGRGKQIADEALAERLAEVKEKA